MSCGNSNAAIESSESRVQENNENPTIKNNEGKKVKAHKQPPAVNWDDTQSPVYRGVFLTELLVPVFQEEPSQNATPDAGTEASPVKRRGRPPKTAATPGAEKKEAGAPTGGGAGRGRKRAADSNPSAESVNIKISKQQQQNDEGTKRQIDLQR